jgi:hypothetical protein
MAHYTITPLEKKSISVTWELFRHNPDGSLSTLTITEHYRWGRGFWSEEDECNLSCCSGPVAHCRPDQGEWEGCEFDDSIACYFDFSDDVTEEEQEEIKNYYYYGDDTGRSGAGWVYEGDHEWEMEDEYVDIQSPYKIEYCDEDGQVIREVALRSTDERIALGDQLGSDWYVPNDAAIEPYRYQ